MRRLLLTALVVAASVVIARGASIHPVFQGGAMASARETAGYRIDAKGVRFPLSQGTRRLRILVNLDLAPTASPEGVGFSLRVRIPEEQYEEQFALLGMARVRLDGKPAAFYLGESTSPAWAREIALERRQSEAATLEVSLLEPEGALGTVRVLAEAVRAPLAADVLARRNGPVERNQLASGLGPLDWDQLPVDLQADLLQRRWTRIPATPGALSRRLYVAGAPAPVAKPEEPAGEPIEEGQVAAYTLQGPGVLRVFAVESPLNGRVELLQADGQLRTQPIALKSGDRLDLAVGQMLTTARVRVSEPSKILAIISDRKLALASARLEPRADGEWVMHPAVGLERNPRAEPEPALPVVYDLRGRAGRELHVTVRLRMRPGDKPTLAHVRWTLRDEERRAVAKGAIEQALSPAPEDRIDGEPGMVPTEPAMAYLWPPPSAAILEVTSDPPALIAVDSPGFAPPEGEAGDSGVKPLTALRHAPVERPLWFRVRPSNEDELLAGGRIERLRSATRLEAIPPPPPPTVLAETLALLEKMPRFTLLAPGKPDAPLPELGVWWPLANGVASEVRFDPLPGSSPKVRIPWNVLFLGDASSDKHEAAIRVDSSQATRAMLFTSRGTLSLAPTTPGVHRVEIAIGKSRASSRPPPRLFVDHPTGSMPFRAFSVYSLRDGKRATVRLQKSAEPRSLGAVLYFDGSPGEGASLEVTIDGGRRTPPATRFSRLRSRLTRVLPLHADALVGASYLNRRTSGIWGSTPLFVGLADDIRAGNHVVSLVLKGTRAKAFVRLFSYGGPQYKPERLGTFGEFGSAQ